MRRTFIVAALFAGLLMSGVAVACGGEQFMQGVIHNELPSPLPAGTLIAEVDIAPDASESELFRSGVRARIRRLVQGEYRGDFVVLRGGRRHSCYYPFANGRSGLIIGVPLELEGDVLTVRPIEVGRNQRFRLPDGFQLRMDADWILID
jgi:hypothetical protein